MSEFIRAENIFFSYPSEKKEIPALRGISVSIKEGEYVAVLGHNGSGKSTFAKLLNMILTPTSGRLFVAGEELTGEGFDEEALFRLRRQVGMVFQNPDNQLVASVVEEDVAFGCENLGVPYDEMHERVEKALDRVGMTEYRRHAPSRLSGGQKQRVAIAGILAMQPRCMILDEATAMLDPSGRREVLETVERLNREDGLTLIHITHYMDEAARADRILVIHDGELLLDGTPREVFSNAELLHKVDLETTAMGEVSYLLQREGVAMPLDCFTLEECADALEEILKGK